jgi:hypothetical protein
MPIRELVVLEEGKCFRLNTGKSFYEDFQLQTFQKFFYRTCLEIDDLVHFGYMEHATLEGLMRALEVRN